MHHGLTEEPERDGVIVAVNMSWQQFSNDNGGKGAFLGENYLDVCRYATGIGAEAAHRFGTKIEDVLLGRCEGLKQSISVMLQTSVAGFSPV